MADENFLTITISPDGNIKELESISKLPDLDRLIADLVVRIKDSLIGVSTLVSSLVPAETKEDASERTKTKKSKGGKPKVKKFNMGKMFGNMGKSMKGIFSSFKIPGLVSLILMALQALKQVTMVVGKIIKLVGQALRPIMMVIEILLRPLIIMIKPLAKLANEVMRPFRQLSMQLLKASFGAEGEEKAELMAQAFGVSLTGLTTMIGTLVMEVLKQTWGATFKIGASILDSIGLEFLSEGFNSIGNTITDLLESGQRELIFGSAESVAKMIGSSLGDPSIRAALGTFRDQIVKLVSDNFFDPSDDDRMKERVQAFDKTIGDVLTAAGAVESESPSVAGAVETGLNYKKTNWDSGVSKRITDKVVGEVDKIFDVDSYFGAKKRIFQIPNPKGAGFVYKYG